MKITAMKFLKLVTLVPYLLLAVYAFLIRKDILLGCVFLGLEGSSYWLLFKKRLHYDTIEEKIMINSWRLVYVWMFILLFSFLLFENISYRWILFGLAWAPPGILLTWAACTGRWKEALQSRF